MHPGVGFGAGEPADQMDRGAQRELHLRRAGPRPRHPCRTGARQERQIPGAQSVDPGQSRRVPLDLRAGGADLSLRDVARRHVHHAGDLRRSEGDVHQYRAGRRLSRRRAARGLLCDRTYRRHGRAGAEDRSGGTAAAQFHRQGRLSLSDAGRARLRFWRLFHHARHGLEGGGLRRLRQAARGGGETRQAARHRPRLLYRGVRRGAVGGGGRLGRACRAVRDGRGAGPPDRLHHHVYRHAQPRPKPRAPPSRR